MSILLPDYIRNLQVREQIESNLKVDLVMLLTKPVRYLESVPQEWTHCAHIDMCLPIDPDSGDLLEVDPHALRVMLNTLIGHLACSGRRPIDICAVKSPPVYSIVVRTEEQTKAAAA